MALEWEHYLKEVLPDVKGCPVTIAENAIRNAAIEFCNESRVWREQAENVQILQDNAGPYTIDVSNINSGGAQILAAHKVKPVNNNLPLHVYPIQLQDDRYTRTGRAEPQWYYFRTPDTLFVGPGVPQEDVEAEVFVTLKPTRQSTTGPDFLCEDWLEEIAHGAKARLMAMAQRPWANPDMVRYHRREFINGWIEARIRDAKSNVVGSSKTFPYQKFGRYHNNRYFR